MPYPVEKKLNRWQSLKMELGGWAFVLVIACVIGWLTYRLKKK
ncbi:putative lipoprotein [Bacteroides ovatus SD CMC 3f]|nr:putative lipoprotein [Bacteroides ovatus SD CMC 3f]